LGFRNTQEKLGKRYDYNFSVAILLKFWSN
jgi:hypothetical protein